MPLLSLTSIPIRHEGASVVCPRCVEAPTCKPRLEGERSSASSHEGIWGAAGTAGGESSRKPAPALPCAAVLLMSADGTGGLLSAAAGEGSASF